MVILGFETSTPVCSVALVDAHRVLGEYTLEIEGHHAGRLLPMVERLLQDVGLRMSAVEGIAVASGPGSFTGVRIGMSTAKGLCLSLGVPMLSVSTLAGMAYRYAFDGVSVCAVVDARRGEVYAGVYQRREGDLIATVPDTVLSVEALLQRLDRSVLFVGDGGWAYHERILDVLGGDVRFVSRPFGRPSAASIALLGEENLRMGNVADLWHTEPNYLKRTQAERVRRGAV